MTAYNLLNGTYCSENSWLMEDIAREEWGFRGAYVCDWGAENNNATSLPAGLDLVMPGRRVDYRDDVAHAVTSGVLPEESLNQAVQRILELHAKHEEAADLGIVRDQKARLDVARQVAEESAVLLENDGVLPLAADAPVAIIGAFSKHPRYQGAGSSKINPVSLDCAFDALEAAGITCSYAEGYEGETGEASEVQLAEAERIAHEAAVAVVFVGLPDASESEGADRATMALPAGHNALVKRVCAANPNTVVVLQGGSPVELPWRDEPRAILLSYLCGCRGGRATANLLLGRANPSGKLAETWPESLADTPCAGNYPAKGRQAFYRESIFTGYRYYDAARVRVAYPFGHGLSYTRFAYNNLRVEPDGDGFTIAFDVCNVGERFGKEAVQLYVAPQGSSVFKAPQQLKAFAKVALEPGEEQRVELSVPYRAFAHYNPVRHAWEVERGCYEVRVAASSRDVRLRMIVQVEGVVPCKDTVPQVYHEPQPGAFTNDAFKVLYGRPFPKVLTAMRPYTANATIGDLRTSLLGRVVHYVLRRELKLLIPGDKVTQKSFDQAAMDTPLRSVAMSGMDMRLIEAVVDLLNYHFIRGYKLLRSLKPEPHAHATEIDTTEERG